MAVVAQLRYEEILLQIDPNAVYAAQAGFLTAEAADQFAGFAEDRDGSSSTLFGDVDQPLWTAVDIAG